MKRNVSEIASALSPDAPHSLIDQEYFFAPSLII
jgi:hypothetical protein